MSGISKSTSTSSRRALLPYLSSTSSRLNLGALAALGSTSTSSLSAFFSSASSSSIFRLGSRREVHEGTVKEGEQMPGRSGKENVRRTQLCRDGSEDEYVNVCESGSSSSMFTVGLAKKVKLGKKLLPRGGARGAQGGGVACPEISAPQLSADTLAAVKARFTLVPIVNADNEGGDKSKISDKF